MSLQSDGRRPLHRQGLTSGPGAPPCAPTKSRGVHFRPRRRRLNKGSIGAVAGEFGGVDGAAETGGVVEPDGAVVDVEGVVEKVVLVEERAAELGREDAAGR